ncbi:hypothetical protein FIBSPDRAFT_859234, partial [Athelia psychrophila]
SGIINLGSSTYKVRHNADPKLESTRPTTFLDTNSDRLIDHSCEPCRSDISIRNFNRPPPCPHLPFPHTPSSFWTIQ